MAPKETEPDRDSDRALFPSGNRSEPRTRPSGTQEARPMGTESDQPSATSVFIGLWRNRMRTNSAG